MFGEMSVLTGRARTADALCTMNTELLCLEREQFDALAAQLVRNMAAQLSDRLREATRVACL
jgi:CRP-like cAMP-binding protein